MELFSFFYFCADSSKKNNIQPDQIRCTMAKKKQNPASAPPVSAPKSKAAVDRTPSKPFTDSDLFYLFLLALVVGVYAYFRSKFLSIPLERDEGTYAYMGQLLLDGKRPYLDFYEMKPPALYYSYALLVGLVGTTVEGLHAAALMVCVVTAVLIYYICKILYHREAGLMAALVYLILSLGRIPGGYTAQAEHLVVVWAVAGFFFAAKGWQQGKAWQWILAGAFFANAVMTKQVAGVFAPAAVALAWAAATRSAEGQVLRKTAIYTGLMAAGGIAVVGAWLLLIMGYGAWNEMMYWLFEYPKGYTSFFSWNDRKGEFWKILKGMYRDDTIIWTMAIAGLFLSVLAQRYRYLLPFLVLLFAAAFIGVMPGYYFYGHYWLYFSPVVAICAGAAVSSLRDRLSAFTPLAAYLGILLVAAVFFLDYSNKNKYYLRPNFKQIMYTAYSDNPFPETDEVAKFLKRKAQPGDQLLVMGSEPQLNYLTGMRSPTRHFFMGYLTKSRPEEAAWIKETKEAAETSKPRFVVTVVHPYSWAYIDNKNTDMFNYAFEFTKNNYKLIGIADMQPGATKYIWGEAAETYPRIAQGVKHLLVYERKPGI